MGSLTKDLYSDDDYIAYLRYKNVHGTEELEEFKYKSKYPGVDRFMDGLWASYPIPREVSIWGGDLVVNKPLKNLAILIDSCILDCQADLYLVGYQMASGMITKMPKGCFAVESAKLIQGFPGNRIVKVSYDADSNQAYTRYFPCKITYRQHVTMDNLDFLKGEQRRYFKNYCLWQMGKVELQMLKGVNLNTDNGEVNLDALQDFVSEAKQEYNESKQDVIIYTSGV